MKTTSSKDYKSLLMHANLIIEFYTYFKFLTSNIGPLLMEVKGVEVAGRLHCTDKGMGQRPTTRSYILCIHICFE